jgi:uncharacterized protein YbjT (DUF2867 family)
MILVTTAGKVGSEASRRLAQQGVPVRVIVRNDEKSVALATDGVDVFKGDLEVPGSIDAALQGVSSVVLVTAPILRQELNVIDSAVRAGIVHVVKITTRASADSPIARRRNHAQIENALIASGLGYTLLRNNAYMQNFLMMAPGSRPIGRWRFVPERLTKSDLAEGWETITSTATINLTTL